MYHLKAARLKPVAFLKDSFLTPSEQLPVQRAVLDGFADVVFVDGVEVFDIGDGAGESEELYRMRAR